MNFQILDIAIYHHDGRSRVVSLKPGRVNIITGDGKAGKTALIEIVDYCLGKNECRVPDGPIRTTVAWFALRLQLDNAHAIVARRCPVGKAKSSDECYVRVASELNLPDMTELSGNTNTAALVQKITQWCGIEDNVHVPPDDQTRPPLAASIRHALCFCFQPQDEIIRREQLFSYRGSASSFVEQGIKDTLPYFLGAVDPEFVRKRAQHARLRNELRQAQRDISELLSVRGHGQKMATSLVAEARDAGLTDEPTPERVEDTFELLKRLARTAVPALRDGVEGAIEFDRLSEHRNMLTALRRRLRFEIEVARDLVQQAQGVQKESREQESRLRSIGIFEHVNPSQACPNCSQPVPAAQMHPSVQGVKATLASVSDRLASVRKATPQVEADINALESKLAEVRQSLVRNRGEFDAVLARNKQLERADGEIVKRSLVVGRISLYTETLPDLPSTQALEERIERLKRDCKLLEEQLSDDRVREKLESILALVNQSLTTYAQLIELEHAAGGSLRLDIRNLTVVADTPDGPVPMYRMGSGENWVGYHIAVHLALHDWFSRRSRPVPGFLFLDQVSQTGSPSETSDARDEAVNRSAGEHDLRLFERVFNLICTVVDGAASKLQVIMLEHLDLSNPEYQAAVVSRWRNGEKLIPADWFDTDDQKGG